VVDGEQRFVPSGKKYPHPIHKPQLTKYTRALNARGSLLYWKAANQRTDGRTDRQYTARSGPGWEDVDFGASHPTSITKDELGVISRWLDTGAAAEAGFLLDTTPPALHLAAGVQDRVVTTLYVGTVDVVSGVDAGSLEVCIVRRRGECGENLAQRAAPHGVLTIRLPKPLRETDGDLEIRARVRDRAGNSAEVQHTVRWLLNQAAGAPALPPSAAPRR
jgi:hypothetical protein